MKNGKKKEQPPPLPRSREKLEALLMDYWKANVLLRQDREEFEETLLASTRRVSELTQTLAERQENGVRDGVCPSCVQLRRLVNDLGQRVVEHRTENDIIQETLQNRDERIAALNKAVADLKADREILHESVGELRQENEALMRDLEERTAPAPAEPVIKEVRVPAKVVQSAPTFLQPTHPNGASSNGKATATVVPAATEHRIDAMPRSAMLDHLQFRVGYVPRVEEDLQALEPEVFDALKAELIKRFKDLPRHLNEKEGYSPADRYPRKIEGVEDGIYFKVNGCTVFFRRTSGLLSIQRVIHA